MYRGLDMEDPKMTLILTRIKILKVETLPQNTQLGSKYTVTNFYI